MILRLLNQYSSENNDIVAEYESLINVYQNNIVRLRWCVPSLSYVGHTCECELQFVLF